MTNITAIVTVCLVTNVTERFPQHWESMPCPERRLGCLVNHGQNVNDANPKEKWVTTNVVEVTTLRFDWLGNQEIKSERAVTNWTAHFVLQEPNWIQVTK